MATSTMETNTNQNLAVKIEALLFFKGEPLSIEDIAKLLSGNEEKVTHDDVVAAVNTLEQTLVGRGLSLVQTGTGTSTIVELRTSPEQASFIESIIKNELSKDLGKAGLETLSIILYRGPVKRSDIDYIRGVSSQYIVRNLLMRGLIERVTDVNDTRSVWYRPTIELLSLLGVTKVSDLPEYEKVKAEWEKASQQIASDTIETNNVQ